MASSSEMETRYLPTREAYEEWADVCFYLLFKNIRKK